MASFLLRFHGCLLIGAMAAFLLYGMVLILAAQYFRDYPSDHVALKMTIALFLIAATIQIVAGFGCVYQVLIDEFGKLVDHIYTYVQLYSSSANSKLTIFDGFGKQVWVDPNRGDILYRFSIPMFLWNEDMDIIQEELFVNSTDSLALWALARVTINDRLSLLYEAKPIFVAQECVHVINDLFITSSLCYLLYRNRYRSGPIPGNSTSASTADNDINSLITTLLISALNRGVIILAI
ncbi:hypothetical protein D9758_016320 [Tetrapyrgos nigripes]|uniref:Uncharacterized protein n=1 Tax=Tetrapyrgos nigripes TaxID=182062 RepID=A0A8H5C6I3_9AGAR|nr:hypothetical protein D9758_016320 [Tetrapyrgos nigripes]